MITFALIDRNLDQLVNFDDCREVHASPQRVPDLGRGGPLRRPTTLLGLGYIFSGLLRHVLINRDGRLSSNRWLMYTGRRWTSQKCHIRTSRMQTSASDAPGGATVVAFNSALSSNRRTVPFALNSSAKAQLRRPESASARLRAVNLRFLLTGFAQST